MKLKLTTSGFLASLDLASHAILNKMRMPILTSALIEVREDGTGTMACDSLDCRIEVSLSGLEASKPFSFVASPRMLRASLRADEATLELKDGKLHIDSGGRSSFFTLPVDEFPKKPDAITVKPTDSARLLSALKSASACANPDSGDINNSVYWSAETKHLFSIGKGRSMLSIHPLDLEISENFNLPASSCRTILSVFDVDDSFSIGLEEKTIQVQKDGVKGWFKTVDAITPNHRPLIPDEKPFATAPRESLIQALDALQEFVDAEGRWVTMSKVGASWSASTTSASGESSVPVDGIEQVLEVDPFIVSQEQLTKFLRSLSADEVRLHKSPNMLMVTPNDASGAIGVFAMKRPS